MALFSAINKQQHIENLLSTFLHKSCVFTEKEAKTEEGEEAERKKSSLDKQLVCFFWPSDDQQMSKEPVRFTAPGHDADGHFPLFVDNIGPNQ